MDRARRTDRLTAAAVGLAESGRLPDLALRWGIRQIARKRLRDDVPAAAGERARLADAFARAMRAAPIAPVPERANHQHYEVEPAFFRLVLGPRLKYSSCYFPPGVEELAAAEDAALATTAARAGLADGQRVLDLGCGWGSMTLWAAARYPASRVTAVSNSALQRRFIEARAAERGLANVEVVTADMNLFEAPGRFDRVISVEMFEHMRNYPRLLERIAGWLEPGGQLLIHIFCHRDTPYAFEDHGEDDWMARHFFTGGIMPSDDLLARFQDHLALVGQWRWDGTHYQRTAEAWLANLDARAGEVTAALARTYGADAELWRIRWRLFFLACAEMFGYAGGREWWVSHYRFARRS